MLHKNYQSILFSTKQIYAFLQKHYLIIITIIIYIYIAHNNQKDSLHVCALQELSYSYSEKK